MRVFFVLFFLTFQTGISQQADLVNKTALKADTFVGFDAYKHIYYIEKGALHKEGELGTFVFQDFQLGPIATVDMINPLNVVVFYAETNTVVFLDNRLNEKERILFNELPSFLNVSTATNAGNSRLWVFNVDTQQLELFHYRNRQETQVSQPFKGKLVAQTSTFNDCTLLTDTHLRQLNVYGSLLFEIPLEGFEKIVQYSKTVLGLKENNLYLIGENTVRPLPIPLNEKPIKDLQLTQDFLYIYDGKTLYTFTLTQPKP
ncbi:MAG: hypothetical protein R2793_04490 [Flavobacteriaceae bacterium]